MSTCRYTGKELAECDCNEGCDKNSIDAGEWLQPITEGYRMECCECGPVHLLDFRIIDGNIQFRAFREGEKEV